MLLQFNEMLAKFQMPNDFEYNEPVTRFSAKLNKTLVGRFTRGFGEVPEFEYGGRILKNDPWESSPQILAIRNELEKQLSDKLNKPVKFHHVLVGLYPNGEKAIEWHSDEMVSDNDIIANVSLGATRTFSVRYNDSKEQYNFSMKHGDVIVFDGYTNSQTEHTVPAEPHVTEPRVSLTFRTRGN